MKAEKEQKKLMRDRAKLEVDTVNEQNMPPQKQSILTLKGRLRPSQTYSDIVGTASKHHGSAVSKKALAKRAVDDFKVVEVSFKDLFFQNPAESAFILYRLKAVTNWIFFNFFERALCEILNTN